MKQEIETGMQEEPLFTVDDHLLVQQQVEASANEFWRARGCCDEAALSDWLRAEREVLEKFVLAYALRSSVRSEARRGPIANAKPPTQKTSVLRQCARPDKSQ
jgi:hypothetical protein